VASGERKERFLASQTSLGMTGWVPYENGGFGIGGIRPLLWLSGIAFVKHVFRTTVSLPCGSLRDSQRLLAFSLKFAGLSGLE
jgi:hypothetical protein